MTTEEDDNEFMDLPDDPEQGFAILQKRKFKWLQDIWEDNRGGSNYFYERQYIDTLVAYDEVHALGILKQYAPSPNNDREFSEYFEQFRRYAEVAAQKIQMESARRLKTGAHQVVVLDTSSRQAIHALIEKIKEKLNDLDLPENKREALFNRLNAFAAEIDRNRTRTESFYAFAVETARAGRAVSDEIKPLQQTIDRVFDMIDKAKKLIEALPPWAERKKIEGPKPLHSSDRRMDYSIDDDIPF